MSSPDSLQLQPRRQHYLFAHRALPQLFFRNPDETLALLEGNDGVRFLSDLWAFIGKDCEPDEQVELEGLYIEPFTLGDVSGVIIALPTPQAVTEAFFVSMLSRKRDDGDTERHYYTLELGVGLEAGTRRSVLCAWTAEGAHLNMGDGPEPSLDAFAAVIGARWLH